MLIEASKKDRTHSSPQKQETVIPDVPHEIRSLVPPNNNVRSISPSHYVVFPPEIPPEYRMYSRSKTSSPYLKHENNVQTKTDNVISSVMCKVDNTISQSTLECFESIGNRKSSDDENVRTDKSNITQKYGINDVTNSDRTISSADHPVKTKSSHSINECLEVNELSSNHRFYESENSVTETSYFSQEQFISNADKIEPVVESKLQVNIVEDGRAKSSIVAALKTVSDRSSCQPPPTSEDASEIIPKQVDTPVGPKTESNIKRPVGNNPVRYIHGYNKKKPEGPSSTARSLIYSPESDVDTEEGQVASTSIGLKSFSSNSKELQLSTASVDFDYSESNLENSEELVFGKLKFKEPVKSLNKKGNVAVEPAVTEPLDKLQFQQSIPGNPPRASFSDTFSGKLVGPGIQDKVFSFTPSIEKTSFFKQKPNVPDKIDLDYEPSSLGHSSFKNSDSIAHKPSNSEPNSSKYTPDETVLKSNFPPESIEESIPLTTHTSQTDNTLVEPVTPVSKSSLPAAFLSKKLTCLMKEQQPKCIPIPTPKPDIGGQPTGRAGVSAGLTVPRRGRGVLNPQNLTPGAREPLCGQCHLYIRGPFITALGKIWCPEHFVCVNNNCKRPLQDIGFVEEDNGLYCEYCFEQFLAPVCHKCSKKIKGDCLNAIGKQFHPECFNCAYCGKLFGNSPFFLEDSLPYCEKDWNELFTTKCIACGFPIEAGDRWVEALDKNYHSPCFNCSKCKVNLEGQSFFAKGGRPYCKSHAR